MHKKQKYIVLIVCLVIVLAFAVFLRTRGISSLKNINEKVFSTQSESVISSTLIVDKETFQLTSTQGESLYDMLLKEKESNTLSFSGKEYAGMGFFTTDIGTLHSTKDHYLMYYVNGKEGEVGISSYFPKNGDVIEWKLK
jgi:hypothetical protein